eukprot:1908516-Amphidinium_carterae.1
MQSSLHLTVELIRRVNVGQCSIAHRPREEQNLEANKLSLYGVRVFPWRAPCGGRSFVRSWPVSPRLSRRLSSHPAVM